MAGVTDSAGAVHRSLIVLDRLVFVIILSLLLATALADFAKSGPGSSDGLTAVRSATFQTSDPTRSRASVPTRRQTSPKGKIRGPFTLPSNAYPGTCIDGIKRVARGTVAIEISPGRCISSFSVCEVAY
jgi:hypothetical protein